MAYFSLLKAEKINPHKDIGLKYLLKIKANGQGPKLLLGAVSK